MLDALSERMRKTERFASLKVMAKGFNMNKLGNVAKAFELNTATGTPVSLTSYKGKYVLIDFWASWCAPCRAENPDVVKAYNEFKDKNFDIAGTVKLIALYGLGNGMVLPFLLNIVLDKVPVEDAGAASGIFSTVQQTALGLGISIIGGIFFAALHSHDYMKAVRYGLGAGMA